MPKVVSDTEIFTATVSVYSSRGFVNASVSEIADLASINEVTLFRRFGTKATLIERALTDLLAKSAFAHLSYSGDLEADLITIVAAYSETNATFGAAVVNLITEIPRHEELRPAASVMLSNMARVVDIIARHQQAARLIAGPPVLILNKLIAPLMMQAGFERSFGKQSDEEVSSSDHVRMFLGGMGLV